MIVDRPVLQSDPEAQTSFSNGHIRLFAAG
jgi:hypothetical protein